MAADNDDDDLEWIEKLYKEWELDQIEKMIEEADAEQRRKDGQPPIESDGDGTGSVSNG
jgi:hypothetical protein